MYIVRSEKWVVKKKAMNNMGGQCGSSAPPNTPALSDVIRCFGVTMTVSHFMKKAKNSKEEQNDFCHIGKIAYFHIAIPLRKGYQNERDLR